MISRGDSQLPVRHPWGAGELESVLDDFRSSYLGQQLYDPDLAAGNCKPGALGLLILLWKRGVGGAQLLHLERGAVEHYVVAVDDALVLDPSSRQFRERDPVPQEATLESIVKEWPTVTRVDIGDAWQRRVHMVPAVLPDWENVSRARLKRQGEPDSSGARLPPGLSRSATAH